MLQEKDKKFIEQQEAIRFHNYHGGTKHYMPKSGPYREGCLSCAAYAGGQIQGYLYALRVYGLITEKEWEDAMQEYTRPGKW